MTQFFAVAAALALPVVAFAQADISPLDGYTPGQVLQGAPGGSIPLSGIEVYNPASGQISINIPLLTVHGRGPVSVPLLVSLTSPVWDTRTVQFQHECGKSGCITSYAYIAQTVDWNPLPSAPGQGGSLMMRGSGHTCNGTTWDQTLTRGTFTAPDGTEIEFIDTGTSGALESPGYSRGTGFVADNGSGAKFVSSSAVVDPTGCRVSDIAASGVMTLSNGTMYTIVNGAVTQIEDSNGNITMFSASAVTDNLGRAYSFGTGSDSTGNYDSISYQGYNNTTRTIKIRYDSLTNHLASGQSIETYGTLWPTIPTSNVAGSPSNLTQNFDPNDIVSEIDLADGSSYQFQYDSYGDVVQITLPLGGKIQYSYSSSVNTTAGNPKPIYLMSRLPTQRTQLLGTSVISQMTFPGGGEIDRYDGSGNLLAKETHTITDSGTLPTYATNYNSYQYNQSSANTYYDSTANGGGVLESQTVTYFQAGNCKVNCSTAQTVTTTLGSVVKQTSFSYDQYSNLTEQKDSTWGGGSPNSTIRDTQISYSTASGNISANILGLATETKVFDGSGNLYSDTQVGYDLPGINSNGTSITPAPGISGTYHDNTSYNGNASRGNPTVSRICQTISGAGCGAWLSYAFNSYDSAGNLIQATDASGHSTWFGYGDNYYDGNNSRGTDAMVTSVTNAYSQVASTQYDYYTGQPTLSTDVNNISATYVYNDPLDRLSNAYRAVGTAVQSTHGQQYSVPSTTISVADDQSSVNDQLLESARTLDGFGRPIETGVSDGTSTGLMHTITYDGLGRVQSVTGPYHSTDPSSTWPITTYSYDGLGRRTKVTTADGASVSTSYSGNQTTVTDQAGNVKVMTSDGLGRVCLLVEGSGSPAITTNYVWRPTGTLEQVTQGSEVRYFTFDSANRLISTTQPENGVINYTYDNVGNPYTAADSRGVTKTYTFDKLNRLTNIAYSGGSVTTPAAIYTYDNGASGSNSGNSRGRLLSISNSSSNTTSTTSYTAYDPLGNVLASSQQTGSSAFGFTYTYNLASQLISEKNQHGRTLTTAYDRAGRPLTLAGSLSGNSTTYVSQTSYGLFGLLYYYVRGNNVWHVQSYNNRLQPTQSYEATNNSYGSLLFISCPNWGVNYNWGVSGECPTASATNDNGTLQSYEEFQGGAGYPSFTSFTQTFTYDNVNRLISGTDSGGWGRTFNYDQWGNMWVTNATGYIAGPTPTSNVYNAKNQISTLNYDAAGNLITLNANTPSYDAENRMTAVTASGGGAESILYDALGQRVQKTVGGSTTVYVYDAFGMLSSEYVNGMWSRDYITDGSGNVIATENASGLCTTCYFGTDHLGSVRIVMDQNGGVVARHDYLPFGEELPGGMAGRTTPGFGAADLTTQRFTGQVRDSESGQDFFNARYFMAPLGRFNSADPGNAGADLLSSQSWNGYGYVNGNPLNAVDPSGMFAEANPPPIPVSCPGCSVSVDGGGGALVDTWSWWMDGGWRTLAGSLLGGGGDNLLFTAIGLGKADVPTVSTQLNTTLSPAKTGTQKSCPSVPLWPPNKPSVNANMQQSQNPQPIPGLGLVSAASTNLTRLAIWFANVCCWSSTWNFQGGDNGNSYLPQYDNAGNFNFGATGVAAGVPATALMWGGGLVKNINYWSKGKPNPYRNQPYMNDPAKMAMIAKGIQYAQNGCF